MGPGIFPDAQSQFLNSMYGLLSSIQGIIITIGVVLFIASVINILRSQKIDITEIISIFLVSVVIIGIGGFGPDLIKKIINQINIQSTVAEQKVEKENVLSGEEKLKKLNDYRKSNHKDILLADKTETEHYINYLKKNDLYKKVLK